MPRALLQAAAQRRKRREPVPKDTPKTKSKSKSCPSSKPQASSGTASVQERDKDYENVFKFLETALEKQSEILLRLNNKMSENVQTLEPQGAKTAHDKNSGNTSSPTIPNPSIASAQSTHGAQIHETIGTVRSMTTSQINENEASASTDVLDDNYELYSESSFQLDYYYEEEYDRNLPTCGQGNDMNETANDECDDSFAGGQQAETLSENAPTVAKGFAARFQAKSDTGPKVYGMILPMA